MFKFFIKSVDSVYYFFYSVWKFIVGILFIILDFFFPIRGYAHLMMLLFILDWFWGFMVAKYVRKEHFSLSIVFTKTISRAGFTIMLLALLYLVDLIHTYKNLHLTETWSLFISGVLIVNIAKNGKKLLNWGVLDKLNKVLNYFKK